MGNALFYIVCLFIGNNFWNFRINRLKYGNSIIVAVLEHSCLYKVVYICYYYELFIYIILLRFFFFWQGPEWYSTWLSMRGDVPVFTHLTLLPFTDIGGTLSINLRMDEILMVSSKVFAYLVKNILLTVPLRTSSILSLIFL